VKILRAELQRNYFILADKWERMAQIIEGETRKYEHPTQAPAPNAPTNGSDVFVAISNGVVNTNTPGVWPKPTAEKPPPKGSKQQQQQQLLQQQQQAAADAAMAQQTADIVEAATAMATLFAQSSPPMAQEANFNPKTYLPKKHKVVPYSKYLQF